MPSSSLQPEVALTLPRPHTNIGKLPFLSFHITRFQCSASVRRFLRVKGTLPTIISPLSGMPLICGIKKKWYKWSYLQNRNRLTDLENKLTVAGGGWMDEGMVRESGMNMYTLLYLKWIEEESRWRRNRTGRSLSLLQIHRKNNRTVKKVYKTTSDR